MPHAECDATTTDFRNTLNQSLRGQITKHTLIRLVFKRGLVCTWWVFLDRLVKSFQAYLESRTGACWDHFSPLVVKQHQRLKVIQHDPPQLLQSVTHLQGRLQQLVYPGDLLTERQVLLHTHRRRSPRFGKVRADKGIRVLQVLDPANDGGHGRVTATQLRLKVSVWLGTEASSTRRVL